ncbi:MAG: PRC-barrel domain-containing protein [Akkermansiaceae bacterium]|nr:PRC-barrel domain-containing protein [Verrucomicrobiales bacterium]
MAIRNPRLNYSGFATGLFLFLFLNQVAAETPRTPPAWLKANQLIGMTVENIDGEQIGKLQNIALDLHSGNLRYVILAPKGIIAARTRLRAVPPQLVSAATAKRDVLGFALTQAQWNRAPTFKFSEIDALGSVAHSRQVNEFYRSSVPWLHPATQESHPAVAEHLSPTGSSRDAAKPPPPSTEIKLANDLIGKSLVNREQEKLGEILNLLVTLDSRTPVLAVFSTGKILSNRDHVYAVPLQDLKLQNGRLQLNANRKALEAAQPLNQKTWGTTRPISPGTPRIFQYAAND